MKFVSGFFKVIALLLMVLVVLGLPLALLGNQVTQPLLDADRMQALVSPQLLAQVTVYRLQQRPLPDSSNAAQAYMLQVLQMMTKEDWVTFYQLVAPPDVTDGFTSQLVSGVSGWLDGADTDILLDLQPIKANIMAQAQPVVSLVLSTLPACTANQLVQMTAYATGLGQEIPLCVPPEPFYSVVMDVGVSMLPAGLAAVPDDLQISAAQLATDNPRLSRMVHILRISRLVTRMGWIALTLVYLVAIPLGARSLAGAFKWAGWPALLAGLQSLLLGLLLQFSHGGLADALLRQSPIGSINVVAGPLAAIFDGVLLQAARPMLLASGIMLGWGIVALALGAILGRKKAAV